MGVAILVDLSRRCNIRVDCPESTCRVDLLTLLAMQVNAKIQVTGKDIEVTPAMRDYVYKKLGKVRQACQ